jgi:hypothetical protein
MAQIDLKNCDFFLEDGYAGPSQAGGLVNRHIADPVSAPTATATGGGSTGGLLAAGDYLISYTYIGVFGETLRSPDSSVLTVASGNKPRVTLPSLPTGVTGINVYVSTANGNRASETKYNASAIVATTYDLTIDIPSLGAPPSTNNAGGYASGSTTFAVDGFSGAVVNLDRFTVAGDSVIHTVSSHSETSLNTTSITFTPALGANVNDDAVITFLPRQLRFKIGEGNMSWTEKRPVVYVKDRGKLDTVRLGDQDPVEVKLDFMWIFLSAAGTDTIPTPEEVLKHTGLAADWVSSSSDSCEPYAVNIVVVYTPPCSVDPETYLLHDFRYEDLGHDLKQGQISITGKCNITAVSSTRG